MFLIFFLGKLQSGPLIVEILEILYIMKDSNHSVLIE